MQLKITGKTLWYCVGWIYFAYVFSQIVQMDGHYSSDIVTEGISFVLVGVHELSHIITAPLLPNVLVSAAGTVGELLFASTLVVVALRQRAYMATVFTGIILSMDIVKVGIYMADARAQALSYIGAGDIAEQPFSHDWYHIFYTLGWLEADMAIGSTVITIGRLVGLVALGVGLMLIYWQMAHRKIDQIVRRS